MKRQIVALTVVVLLSVVVGNARGVENITYNLVSYPASQIDLETGLPDTLSGSITTNGMLGDNFLVLSWQFTIHTGSKDFGPYSGVIFGSPGFVRESGGLTATDKQLILPDPSSFDLYYYDFDNNIPAHLSWYNNTAPTYLLPTTHVYLGGIGFQNNGILSLNQGWANTNPIMNGSSSWVIAQTVPEPSTLVLLGIAAIGLLGWAWQRRKRA
jgi:hypothetical protein